MTHRRQSLFAGVAAVGALLSGGCNGIAGVETIPLLEAGTETGVVLPDASEGPAAAFVGTWTVDESASQVGYACGADTTGVADVSGQVVFSFTSDDQVQSDTSDVLVGGSPANGCKIQWVVSGSQASIALGSDACDVDVDGGTEHIRYDLTMSSLRLVSANVMDISLVEEVTEADGSCTQSATVEVTRQ